MSVPSRQSASWVFVDTGAYYALAFTGDENHLETSSVYRRLAAERRQLVTTNFVLAETHALLLNRLNRAIALQVLETIYASKTRIVRVDETDEQMARVLLRRHRDKDYSLTDALSFVVMERLGITTAFTFDRHFAQHGFLVLRSR